MKKTIGILSVIAGSLFVSAQEITLNWNNFTTIDYGIEKVTVPSFDNKGLELADHVVFYNHTLPANGHDIRIEQPKWEKISSKELFHLTETLLPKHEIFDIHYSINKEGQRMAQIKIATLRYDGKQAYRLRSFTIRNTDIANKNFQRTGTTENPLASGNFYKIKVDKSGIFKITKDFLQANGISPSSINPRNFRIYGNGGIMLPEYNLDTRYSALQENAIQVIGEEDGVWNDGDYALFYAQGPDGYNLYNNTNGNGYKRIETRTDRSNHLKNIYEDAAYYFINFDIGPGKRVTDEDAQLPNELITRYDAYQFINNDEKNLVGLGRIWVENQSFYNEKNITIHTHSAIQPTDVIRYKAKVIGYGSNGNQLNMSINAQNNSTFNIPSNATGFFPMEYAGTVVNQQGNQISFQLTPNISANPNGVFYLDYVEAQYKENLSFNGSQMNFRDYNIDSGTGTLYGFSVANASGLEQIWDVTDITNATRKVNKASGNIFNFGYVANNQNFNNEFVAFRNDAAYTPSFVGKIDNQNLSALSGVEYLIITPTQFLAEAQRLADYHRTKNNYQVEIVELHKIYNEFSSGSQDLTALRDFITKLNTPAGTLKNVLLLGDTSYDFKNRIPNNTNLVLSYQSEQSANVSSSFVSDDYIVMTKPQNSSLIGNMLPDIPIGRLPAANISEAKLLVDKTLAYYNALPNQSTPFGIWRTRMDFTVDDDCDLGNAFHNYVENTLTGVFEAPNTDKPEYNIRKLYMDAYPQINTAGGQRYPEITQTLNTGFNNSLYQFYFGHGGINGWAQERIFTSNEIQNINNYNSLFSRFPLVSTITCEFSLWDEPNTNSAGEQLIKLKSGGAASMITSSRAIDVIYGINFTRPFTEEITRIENDDFRELGFAHLEAKKRQGPNYNHLKVNFLGDPAMKLSRPKKLLEIDNIESPVAGQLRALDFVKITGRVMNANGTVNPNFNGKAQVYIYDKKITKSTRNNDNSGCMNPTIRYEEEGTPIVKAVGKVVNGVFTAEFYMPNDINYTLGMGRILAYADNGEYDVMKNMPYIIGGINPDGLNDNEPPKVKLYMNNIHFANGGITNTDPTLIACVTDDTGINSTGAGVGHDIVTYLDGKIINTTVLNDFYTSGDGAGCTFVDLKDYQKGTVVYPFKNLSPGEHTLTFKIWDINNNSTTETLTFTVRDEKQENLVINRLLNWPNPFTDKTYIHFEHNCDDILDVNAQIYTITGNLVKTISQTVVSEPFLQGYKTPKQAIAWDGRDDYGQLVGKGTYVYKVFVRSQNQEKCKGSATAVEKMVILK